APTWWPPGTATKSRGITRRSCNVAARRWRGRDPQRSHVEPSPLPLGYDLDLAVDDHDGGVVVDRVRGRAQLRGPPLGGVHRVRRQGRVAAVREPREVDDPQGGGARRSGVVAPRRAPPVELLTDARGHAHAAAA